MVREYRRVLLLALIMSGIVFAVSSVAFLLLYETAVAEQRQRLADMVRSHTRLVEVMIRHEPSTDEVPTSALHRAFAELIDAHGRAGGLGSTGEFMVAQGRDGLIVIPLAGRTGRDAVPPLPADSPLAEPMRRALAGRSGTLIGPDYRGIEVMSAYEPTTVGHLAIIAKIDMAEIRAPFVRAGIAVAGLGLVLIALGTTLFIRVSGPMLDRIRTGERRYRDLFDNMSSGVAVLSPVEDGLDFELTGLNDAALRIDKVSRDAVIGRRVTEVFPGVEACGLLAAFRRVHATGISEAIPELYYKDVRVCGWRRQNIYRLPSGEIVSLFHDVSERKAAEERLRAAQRMEVLGQLTGGVAHDFNNLLGIIIGNLQLVAEQIDTQDRTGLLIADALWSAERGAELIQRLLAFARRQPLNPVVVDVNVLIGGMVHVLRRTFDSRIVIDVELEDNIWLTKIDRVQLEAALMNLFVNARDAMPNGGRLLTRSANVTINAWDTDATSVGETVAAGEYVEIAVIDDGIGMPDDILERVFEPFFTTKPSGKGSGLGLSMVYGFVKQSGGFVRVRTRVGHGTTLLLLLPRASNAKSGDERTAVQQAASL